MPWTESRSRDEWLAEVTRRGEQIRRRRRLAVSGVGAVVLLAPVIAVATFTAGGRPERQLQVAAEGFPPAAGSAMTQLPSVLGGEEAVVTSTSVAPPAGDGQSIPPAAPAYSTTTTEVHRRVPATNAVPSNDDPVIRPTVPTTRPPSPDDSVSSSPPLSPTPNPTLPSNDPSLSACPVDGVRVTVTTDQPTYARGTTVSWSSTIENRSGTTCLMSGRAFFHVENSAGKTVGSFPYTMMFMLPVKAEPGKTITNTGSWDQQDCSGSSCVQVPGGTYVVVAGWTEGGQYVGRGSFQITG